METMDCELTPRHNYILLLAFHMSTQEVKYLDSGMSGLQTCMDSSCSRDIFDGPKSVPEQTRRRRGETPSPTPRACTPNAVRAATPTRPPSSPRSMPEVVILRRFRRCRRSARSRGAVLPKRNRRRKWPSEGGNRNSDK